MKIPEPDLVLLYGGFAVAAWLVLVGLYGIVTSKNLVHICLCVTVVQAGTYVLLTVEGYRPKLPAPIFTDSVQPGTATVDPLVQALMLTDVVVEATVAALLLALAIKTHQRTGSLDPAACASMQG